MQNIVAFSSAICKWSAADFDPSGIKAFRLHYSKGGNFVVARDIDRSHKKNYGDVEITFVNLQALFQHLSDTDANILF